MPRRAERRGSRRPMRRRRTRRRRRSRRLARPSRRRERRRCRLRRRRWRPRGRRFRRLWALRRWRRTSRWTPTSSLRAPGRMPRDGLCNAPSGARGCRRARPPSTTGFERALSSAGRRAGVRDGHGPATDPRLALRRRPCACGGKAAATGESPDDAGPVDAGIDAIASRCPGDAATPGTSCEGGYLECEYGDSPYAYTCDYVVLCNEGIWLSSGFPVPGPCQATAGIPSPACPVPRPHLGDPCGDPSLVCEYAQGGPVQGCVDGAWQMVAQKH